MRYRLDGQRPGITFFTPFRMVHTNPVDGGATLSKAELAYFKAAGYKPVAIAGAEPEPPPEEPDPDALAQAKRNQDDADRALRDGMKPLKKRSHIDQRRR